MMRRRVGGVNDTTTSRYLKQPRIEADHLGFRLLNHDHQQYYLGVPEPPRAPEPYKISAASSTMARAHRRSSFVILADNGQITSRSVGGSPTHGRTACSPMSPNRVIYGRSSPFRPRGFKGPLPHAQSRPPSPPLPIQRRFIQPKSLSQGNSPRKQSLIPQPRGGLIGNRVRETKISDRDRWERRSSKRLTTKIPCSNSFKIPPVRRAIEPTTKPLAKSTVNNNKTKVAAITSEKKLNRSPTKIPIRHIPNGRFIQVANATTDKKNTEIVEPKLPINFTPLPAVPISNEATVATAITPAASNNNNNKSELNENDPGLVDLLKQSSGGSGTSSVVNATTTTAVQPLRIDTATILPSGTNKAQTIKEEGKIASGGDTPETTPNSDSIQMLGKNSSPKEEIISGSVQPVEVVVEPMNVEAVIETNKNENIIDIEEDKSLKNSNKEMKKEMDEKQTNVNEKSEESLINPSVTGILITNPSVEKESTGAKSEKPSVKPQDTFPNHGREVSLKSSNGLSAGSVESIRSTDTGVSLDTVRGVSSAREKRGTHIVKRTQDIETLSGNVMNLENQHNGETSIVEVTESTAGGDQSTINKQPKSRTEKFTNWKDSFVKRFRDRWTTSKQNREGMKIFSWRKTKKNAQNDQQSGEQLEQTAARQSTPTPNAFSRFKVACCRCNRWRSKISPAETTSCCRAERSCGLLCKSRRNWCRWSSCCCSCQRENERKRSIRAKHSLTSVAPPPVPEEPKSKIPEVLIEHNSVMRGAIPCLPVPLAWFCLIWNVLIPGSGTLWSGLFNLCVGQPRFSATASAKSRFGALIVDIIVGVSQFFTVLFCLVGWGWSIWWGVMMIRVAKKWKRFKATEASNSDPEARGNEGSLPAVPTQAPREAERTR